HGVELAQLAEMCGENLPLPGIPGSLDELHHGTGEAMRDTAHDHAEGGGGFSLARAGMHDNEPLLAALLGHHPVADGLLLGHFSGVAGILGNVLLGSHLLRSFLTRPALGQMVDQALVPVLRQAKRECDRARIFKSRARKAAAPATVTGEILNWPLPLGSGRR